MEEFIHTTTLDFIQYCNMLPYGSSDYAIGRTLLSHAGDIQELTLEKLAEEAGSSLSSVSRFFRKAGYPDFRRFKAAFVRDIPEGKAYNRSNYYLPDGLDIKERAAKYLEFGLENLKATAALLDLEKLKRIMEMIRKKKRILFIGDVHDLQCFYNFQVNLIYYEKAAFLLRIREADEAALGETDEDTLAFFISTHYQWHKDRMEKLARRVVKDGGTGILLTQEETEEKDLYREAVRYGIPEDKRGGYYSLEYLGSLFCMLLNYGS